MQISIILDAQIILILSSIFIIWWQKIIAKSFYAVFGFSLNISIQFFFFFFFLVSGGLYSFNTHFLSCCSLIQPATPSFFSHRTNRLLIDCLSCIHSWNACRFFFFNSPGAPSFPSRASCIEIDDKLSREERGFKREVYPNKRKRKTGIQSLDPWRHVLL